MNESISANAPLDRLRMEKAAAGQNGEENEQLEEDLKKAGQDAKEKIGDHNLKSVSSAK